MSSNKNTLPLTWANNIEDNRLVETKEVFTWLLNRDPDKSLFTCALNMPSGLPGRIIISKGEKGSNTPI